jgi:hypothetical protein
MFCAVTDENIPTHFVITNKIFLMLLVCFETFSCVHEFSVCVTCTAPLLYRALNKEIFSYIGNYFVRLFTYTP